MLNRTRACMIDGADGTRRYRAAAEHAGQRTAAAGLAGLEWSAGIPGSVGGAVVSNAGAHGGADGRYPAARVALARRAQACWEDGGGPLQT